jgi:hypothetical protein
MALRSTPALLCAVLCGAVSAQEAINSNAATQPGVGRVTLREQLRWYSADSGLPPGTSRVDELLLQSSVFVGVRHDIALGLELPISLRDSDRPGDDQDVDLGDLRFLTKYRFHRADTGPIDTERASVILGLQIPTGDGDSLRPGFARHSLDPIVGAVYTRVLGRHGFNASAEGTFASEDEPHDLRYDGAWLYRVAPAEFAAASASAWYAVAELNGRYESNGDHEVLFSPGLMYEARMWTFECSLLIPVGQELDHRPEIDFGFVLGMRLLF